jgi:hypothetical protein
MLANGWQSGGIGKGEMVVCWIEWVVFSQDTVEEVLKGMMLKRNHNLYQLLTCDRLAFPKMIRSVASQFVMLIL